jgi:hypothetical protein
MAAKSPRPYHTQWPNVGAPTDLPNVLGSPTQDAALEAGDICFVSGTSLYVCTYAALGAAVWETSSFVKARPVMGDYLSITGRDYTSMPSITTFFPARDRGTWDTLYKYLWWQFTCPETGHIPPTYGQDAMARRFNTENDLWAYLATIVPMIGNTYAGMVQFSAYDLEDIGDQYPTRRHCRSSLLATMLGKGHWLRRYDGDRYGLASNFTSSGYYLNMVGDLGRQLVIWYTTNRTATPQDPGVEDDRVIWYSAGKRGGMYNWPHTAYGPFAYAKPVAWNMATASWVSPAPATQYTAEMPFVLYELNKGRFLYLDDWNTGGTGLNVSLRHSVAVMIFPLINGDHLAFAAYPFGVDTFITEFMDPAIYELAVRVKHRAEFADKYYVLTATQDDWVNRSMFNFFVGTSMFSQNICFPKNNSYHLDDNNLPTDVYIARRNKNTGIRSAWKRIVHLRRRIPPAEFRLDPVFRED